MLFIQLIRVAVSTLLNILHLDRLVLISFSFSIEISSATSGIPMPSSTLVRPELPLDLFYFEDWLSLPQKKINLI